LLTQNLVEKYIADGRTGAVICVINATLPEVQNAPIFRILSRLSEELKSNCIGVFAKTDVSHSGDLGCAKVQASIHKCITCVICIAHTCSAQNWLQQVIDPSSNRTFQTIAETFGAGCVALVNRSTTDEAVSISEQLGRESEFFLRKSCMHAFVSAPTSPRPAAPLSFDGAPCVDAQVTFNELGRSCLGLPALISKIDIIIRWSYSQCCSFTSCSFFTCRSVLVPPAVITACSTAFV
jgi:hypothetical protein